MTRKRANGEGTCYRMSNGVWKAAAVIDWTEDGKPVRITANAPTKREAMARLNERRRIATWGSPVTSSREAVDHYLARWLHDRIRGTVADSSYARYQTHRKAAAAHIGTIRLADLRPAHIQQMYARLSDRYAPATISRLRAMLHHAFEDAIGWDLLVKNPVKYADPPRVEKVERTILSTAQARILFDAEREHRWQPLIVLLATTGVRIGEALALTWEDVGAATISVRKGKTKAATRTVPLPDEAIDALSRERARQRLNKIRNRDIWTETDLVFTTSLGTALYGSAVWNAWKAMLRRNDLPDMRIHDLRRTAVAWMREAGIDADVVQVLIGHERLSTTIDIYGSVNRERIAEAGRRLNSYLEDVR